MPFEAVKLGEIEWAEHLLWKRERVYSTLHIKFLSPARITNKPLWFYFKLLIFHCLFCDLFLIEKFLSLLVAYTILRFSIAHDVWHSVDSPHLKVICRIALAHRVLPRFEPFNSGHIHYRNESKCICITWSIHSKKKFIIFALLLCVEITHSASKINSAY